MIEIVFPKSPRKRVVFFVLGLLTAAWLVHLTIELGVEFRLRLKGASIWRSCGRAAGLDFSRGGSFGDSDMALATWLGGLRSLDVTRTNVSNQGVEQVRKLRQLTMLHVDSTQITIDQTRELQRDLPQLVIDKFVIVDGRRVREDYR